MLPEGKPGRLNSDFKKPIYVSKKFHAVKETLNLLSVDTICRQAKCPNRNECFSLGTAAFLLLGPACTRNCAFCGVKGGKTAPVDDKEPERVARAVERLGLSHAVITSVTRDDLADGGIRQFIKTVKLIKKYSENTTVEVLTPDFEGSFKKLKDLLESGVTVFNHNVETVSRLYKKVRPEADYKRSLMLLEKASKIAVGLSGKVSIKSGFMVGLGETMKEIENLLNELSGCSVKIVTVGQYLSPSKNHLQPGKLYSKEDYRLIKKMAYKAGIEKIFAGPFVRSSYHALDMLSA